MASFRAEIWAAEFVKAFNEKPALLDLIVKRYDAQAATAQNGDTIHIPAVSVGAAGALTPGSVVAGSVTDVGGTLVLDKLTGKVLPISLTDARFNLPGYTEALMTECATEIKFATDTVVLALASEGTNSVGTDNAALTDADILEASELLDEANYPAEDRFLVVTPAMASDLRKIETFISSNFGAGQNQNVIGMVRGFTVVSLPSARFVNGTAGHVGMAMHKSAIVGAVAAPHLSLDKAAGQLMSYLEVAAVYGVKEFRANGIVQVLGK